ncbi:MAG: hypothetical protein ACOYN3_04790 [Acidimicrobiia bacterium]
MPRRSGRWIALVVLALVAGLVALTVTGSGRLRSDQSSMNERWSALRAPLDARYSSLRNAANVVDRVGNTRTVTGDITSAYQTWQRARQLRKPDLEVAAANTLEGLGRRLGANVATSAKLRDNPDVNAALATYAQSLPLDPLVEAYDSAAARYAKNRVHARARLAAALFGFDPRAALRMA